LQRALAPAVPQHHAALCFLRHGKILRGVITEIPALARRPHTPGRPPANVVAAFFHAEHNHVAILSLREILLHGLIRAVRIADQDRIAAPKELIQTRAQWHIQL
jgi:hypothetical protein